MKFTKTRLISIFRFTENKLKMRLLQINSSETLNQIKTGP